VKSTYVPESLNLVDFEKSQHGWDALVETNQSMVDDLAPDTVAPQSEAVEACSTADSKKLLLLVEDNSADVFLVEQAIEFHQVPVRLMVAEDGEQACRYFEQVNVDPDTPCPDILLLDLNLPKRSGAEVLEELKKTSRCREMPVVVLTSSDSPDDRQRVAKLGASRYFQKPTSYREFLKIGAILKEVLRLAPPEV
jgi:CheY-like chemotaxis protein